MTKKPTPAQQKLMRAIKTEGVERRCYKAHKPQGLTMTWHWVGCQTERKFADRTIFACEHRGWVQSIRGKLKEETPEGLSGLQLVLGNWRIPDRLELVVGAS